MAAAGLVGVTMTAPPASASCTTGINIGGHWGYRNCDYPATLVHWPDGHRQYFFIGTDRNAIWSTHELSPYSDNWSNYYSLGGSANGPVWIYNANGSVPEYWLLRSDEITILVNGTYNGAWCRYWNASRGWGNWWDC
jgi:hypothetical protein